MDFVMYETLGGTVLVNLFSGNDDDRTNFKPNEVY